MALIVTGIELTPARVTGAAELTRRVGLDGQVRVLEGNVMDLPLPDASQDAVVSQEALLHVPDLARALGEAHRVLCAGGRIAFTNWIIHRPLSEAQRQLLWDGMAATTLIGIDKHAELLRDAGFEIEAIEDETEAWGVILAERLRMYEKLRGEAEAAGTPAGHDDFYRSYVLFVDLVQRKAMGGARFTAVNVGGKAQVTPPAETSRTASSSSIAALRSLRDLALGGLAVADPGPFLHQQLLVLAVGLEIDGGDDVVADQHRQRKVAELALFLRHIGLELVAVAEEQFGALALDDQWIERREDVHQSRRALACALQRLRPRPVLLLAGAFERDRQQLAAADPRLDQLADRGLARRVEMADRIQADDALRTQRAVEQIGGGFARGGRLRRLVPAEMPLHQLIGLQHAVALARSSPRRCRRQAAARVSTVCGSAHRCSFSLSTSSSMSRMVSAPSRLQQPHHLARVGGRDRGEPAVALALVLASSTGTKKRKSFAGT